MTRPQETRQALGPPGDHMYRGRYGVQQTTGNSYKGRNYANHEATSFNNYQNFFYNRALFGLAMYSQEEIKEMHPDKRRRIIKVHKRAQTVLNLWKQEIIVELSNLFFKTIFPKTEITKQLVEDSSPTDESFINKMSFKTLRITKDQVVSKLTAEGILPKNFRELKQEPC